MSYILLEYHCGDCGRVTESLEPRSSVPVVVPCPCGKEAARCLSAVRGKIAWGIAATRGKNEEPPPYAMDTRAIAEGQSVEEFRSERRKKRRDKRRAEIRSWL